MNQRNCGGGGFAQGGPGLKVISDFFDAADTEASAAFYGDHTYCLSRCRINTENPYNPFIGHDLPDNDPRIF